jgi:predicted aconitase with swiveling domain
MSELFQGRSICTGFAEGEALVTKQGISFWGGVDPTTGTVTEVNHELCGAKLTDKILVLPALKGSAGGMWIIIRLARNKTGPKAIVVPKADTILVGSVIMAGIPTVDALSVNPLEKFRNGDWLKVDGASGTVELANR